MDDPGAGPPEVQVFPHPAPGPAGSWFGACGAPPAQGARPGLPAAGIPRLTAPEPIGHGLRAFALVDPDGSLLRRLGPLPPQGEAG